MQNTIYPEKEPNNFIYGMLFSVIIQRNYKALEMIWFFWRTLYNVCKQVTTCSSNVPISFQNKLNGVMFQWWWDNMRQEMFGIIVSVLRYSEVLHGRIQHQVVGFSATRCKYDIWKPSWDIKLHKQLLISSHNIAHAMITLCMKISIY